MSSQCICEETLGDEGTLRLILYFWINRLFWMPSLIQRIWLCKLVLLLNTFVTGGPLMHIFSTLCKNFHMNTWVGAQLIH